MAQLRSAPVAPQSPPKAQNKRQALKEKTNVSRAKAPLYEDDGNTENLVKNARTRRGRAQKAARNEEDFVMTGALVQADAGLEVSGSDAPLTTDELVKSDAPAPPIARTNRRPPRATRKPIQSEAHSKVLEGLKKRMEATARKEAGKQTNATEETVSSSDALPAKPATAHQPTPAEHERSELSLSPSPLRGNVSAVKDKRSSLPPGSVLRPHSTPAVESSILALKNFKRRPRQPSMLQMVQQRTQSARPSAVNAATKEDSSVFDLEDAEEDEIEDDFAPEAEGTPLHVSKAKPRLSASVKKEQLQTAADAKVAGNARKRKSDEINRSTTALDALRAKRRKSDALASAGDELPAETRQSVERQGTPQPAGMPDVQVIYSSPSSPSRSDAPLSPRRDASIDPEVAVPSTEEEHVTSVIRPQRNVKNDDVDDAPNETMAEPASSSPMPSNPVAQNQADELADPITQMTPPRPKRSKLKEKAVPLSTATLQSLLPKRRQPARPRNRKTDYDFASESEDADSPLDASHLSEDEDELGGRLRRQPKATPAKSRKSAVTKTKGRQSKAAPQSTRKPTTAQARKSTTSKRSNNKTYGRNSTTSDKENEQDVDFDAEEAGEESTLPEVSMHEATQSKELEEAKRKFAEVDQWDMEFETMSADHRSSSQTWR